MKRFLSLLLMMWMVVFAAGCGRAQDEDSSALNTAESWTVESPNETVVSMQGSSLGNSGIPSVESSAEAQQAESMAATVSEEENNMTMNIQIGDNVLTATLVQNSSTEALIEMLSEGSVTIEMSDYANMEKVGALPQSLPRNDEQINTDAGDLILYQGKSFVIYYDTNSWSLTRLGKIDNVTRQELKEILGSGSVTAVLSCP